MFSLMVLFSPGLNVNILFAQERGLLVRTQLEGIHSIFGRLRVTLAQVDHSDCLMLEEI